MAAKASARSVNVLCGVGHGPTVARGGVGASCDNPTHADDAREPEGSTPSTAPTSRGLSRPSPPIHRYAPSSHLTDLVDRFWIPVWSLAEPSTQSTLQHPVCLVVVSNTYARFYGVARGRSSVTLEGDGWAVGTMLTPAAGRLLLGRSVATVTDRWVELDAVLRAGRTPTSSTEVRAAMASDPVDPGAHAAAIEVIEHWLATHLPVDEQGLLVNGWSTWLREHPDVTRVADMAREVGTDRAQPPAAGRAATRAERPSGWSSDAGCTTPSRR